MITSSIPRTFAAAVVVLVTSFVFGGAAFADTLSLQWDQNPEPGVVGYVVHVGTQSSTYTQTFDVGRTTIWSFTNATSGQTYCFAVSAYFPGPTHGPVSNEVCGVGVPAPTFVNPGQQSSTRGVPDTLQLAGSDPGGQPVTYGATGLPPGLSLMASTGFISGAPTTNGTYYVTAEASNGTYETFVSFTWTVGVADTTNPTVTITGPTNAPAHTTSASTLTMSGSASDNVGVTQVTWVNSRGGGGTATGTTSWSVSGIALQSGTNTLTVAARDAAGNSSSDTLVVTLNRTPVLNSVPNQTTQVMLATTLQLTASDAEGNLLTYSASGLPPGLAINWQTGLISGAATAAGSYQVTASVSDGTSSASRSFTWTVTGTSGGDMTPPTVAITAPTTASTYQSTTNSVTLRGIAGDNVGVTQVSWADSRGGRGTAMGTTSWSATVSLGIDVTSIVVTARDAAGNSGSDTITVSPPLSATITANRTSPQRPGTAITFMGVGHGGVTPYQYRWRVFDGTRWTVLRDWSTSNIYTWTPVVASPMYQIEVAVRSATGELAVARVPFAIQ